MLGIFLDSEANGLNPFKHKLIEIAFKIVDVETGEVKATYESVIAVGESFWKESDPESLKVNGFSWDEVKKGKPVSTVSKEIGDLFSKHKIVRGGSVFICQNPSFDRAFFNQILSTEEQETRKLPYHWLDLASMYWAKTIGKGKSPWATGYSKDNIAKACHLPSEDLPHKAMNGVNHLLLCYEAVVGYPKSS